MRALCWHGKYDVRVDTVPDPVIHEPTDAIIKITKTFRYKKGGCIKVVLKP